MTRVIVLGAVAVAAGVAGGGWAFGYGPFAHHAQADAPGGAVPVATASVTLGTITASQQDAGTIGYDGSYTAYSGTAGTVTWLPATGTVIRPGGRLYAVDGQDTLLLHGQTPAWRRFGPGMTDGPDVAELQRNLVLLGYDPGHVIRPGNHYDWATQAAIERWQAARGLIPDGVIPLGQLTFLPGPVRVAGLVAATGAIVSAGAPVLTGTSTTAVVQVALPAAQQSAMTPGDRVTITLPDGSTAPGRVLGPAPAAAATVPGGGAAGSAGSGGSGSGSGGQSAGGQSTVGILVAFDQQPDAGSLAGSQVTVSIVTQTQRAALVAPISALLAKPGGGFQVTVVTGGTGRDVTVQTGLFDDTDGLVAISGPGIAAGTQLEVPRS